MNKVKASFGPKAWGPIDLLLASYSTSREFLASDGRYCCIITGGLLP